LGYYQTGIYGDEEKTESTMCKENKSEREERKRKRNQ
jgi:hypothetical protein